MASGNPYHEVYISSDDILAYCGNLRKFSKEQVNDPVFNAMYEEDWSGIMEMLHALTGFDMKELINRQRPAYAKDLI